MTPPRKPYRRPKRYYYEIHLGDTIVDGVEMFRGMLDAERSVDQRAEALRIKMQRPLRGYLIQRLGRRMKHRSPTKYDGEEILL